MRRTNNAIRAITVGQEKAASLERAPHVTGWRVWMPRDEAEDEDGNPCYGIAIALLLSLPIWLVIGLVMLAIAV